MIYLDHNATTPLDERVLEAMLPFLHTFYGNPSSLYRQGRLVRSALDSAREQVAALIDAQPAQIIFTSGGTEANHLALACLPAGAQLAISALEHPSISAPAHRNTNLSILAVDANGSIIPDMIQSLNTTKTGLVSIMLANNETGVMQNIADHTQFLRAKGMIVHTDAVQAVGKIPVSFKELGVQLLSMSSHKIYGPKGCGALVFDQGLTVKPLLMGGGQEQNLRAGTENVAAIIGFGKAAELAKAELTERTEHLLALRALLEQGLSSIAGIIVFAQAAPRLPNTVQFGLPNVDGEMLLMKLDKKGVAVSSGSACASGGGEPSQVLMAMGVEPRLAKSALRISLGKTNTAEEIVKFIEILKDLVCQVPI